MLAESILKERIKKVVCRVNVINNSDIRFSERINSENLFNLFKTILIDFWLCLVISFVGLLIFLSIHPLNGKSFWHNYSNYYQAEMSSVSFYSYSGNEGLFVLGITILSIILFVLLSVVIAKAEIFEDYLFFEGTRSLLFINSVKDIERNRIEQSDKLIKGFMRDTLYEEIQDKVKLDRTYLLPICYKNSNSCLTEKQKGMDVNTKTFYSLITEDLLLRVYKEAYELALKEAEESSIKIAQEQIIEKSRQITISKENIQWHKEYKTRKEDMEDDKRYRMERLKEDRHIEDVVRRTLARNSDNSTWICGYCGNMVSAKQLICPHCNGSRNKAIIQGRV